MDNAISTVFFCYRQLQQQQAAFCVYIFGYFEIFIKYQNIVCKSQIIELVIP